ncbi:DNA-3-methyladenine glycosylase I [Gracilibacillus caseinilyticus]|uniref:DNA-3-methyladenine glycosylase I n=1 Tax=Gracilibacillus caseinilyticus TaxID=2932256 RepID=A0ABY4EVT8_9BACI|nr:DNA-3-methyladenine glycosylase I [Gracilibacillus caseinilyticus]UOQ48518.1 DNA-3-methyladenine glycosylase I [Gracilibacillus caseinilyticus]
MSTCLWPGSKQLMQTYHDKEWCVPSYDDQYIFEMLTLEGAQSGLSWSIVLRKRDSYQEAFRNFDIKYCSQLNDKDLTAIKEQFNVIKHLAKLQSVRANALAILDIQKEFGSFSNFLWEYINFEPIVNNWEKEESIPSHTDLSTRISKDLKKRNFKFVGPVTIYSFMQAIGMVNDHITTCRYR